MTKTQRSAETLKTVREKAHYLQRGKYKNLKHFPAQIVAASR